MTPCLATTAAVRDLVIGINRQEIRPPTGQVDSPGSNPLARARFTKLTDSEHPEFGVYEYEAVLDALAAGEQRTRPHHALLRVVSRIREPSSRLILTYAIAIGSFHGINAVLAQNVAGRHMGLVIVSDPLQSGRGE